MSKLSFLSFHRSIKKPSSPKAAPRHTHSYSNSNSKEMNKSSNSNSNSNMRSKSLSQPNTITEEVRKVFKKLDANGDGKISLEEYKKSLNVLTNKIEATEAFQAADTDGDGFIDLDEFTKVYGNDGAVKSSEIQSAFKVFDSNGDGKISAVELMEVLRRMGERASLEGCKKMIKGVDRDGDGLIDMDEFTTMMKQNNIKNHV